ncbi:hypothetical protein [Paenibacillus psychroresistens]|nr:hypothetical protein [Paenibacillus psychroresistens]
MDNKGIFIKRSEVVDWGDSMRSGDQLVLLLIIGIIGIALFMGLRSRLNKSAQSKWVLVPDEEIPVTDAVALLENAGYEVMTTKRKIPIRMLVDDQEELFSRYFVDHFAQSEDKWYVVKIARSRNPFEMRGSSIRDQLLPYQLIYLEAAGVLYVDVSLQKIVKIQFELEI